jgi:hypothetical protein
MRKHYWLAILAMAAVGCGGGGDAVGSASNNSPYTGNYTGNFGTRPSEINYTGTVTNMVIRPDGSVDGSVHSDQVGNGAITGDISDAGFFRGTTDYPSQTKEYPTSGQLSFTSTGHLTGQLTEVIDGKDMLVDFDLVQAGFKRR